MLFAKTDAKMEVITVTSHQRNPSRFTSNFLNCVELSQSYQVALLKIAHGPVANITLENNRIHLVNKALNKYVTSVEIPPGYYKSSHDILTEMHNQLNKQNGDYETADITANLKYKSVGSSDLLSLSLTDSNLLFFNPGNSDITLFKNSILFYLDYKVIGFKSRTLTLPNYDLKP